jgi:hypothetical protein
VAESHEKQLRDARHRLAEAMREREDHAMARDRRALADAKEEARSSYRHAVSTAIDDAALELAAATWLNEIHRLNRGALGAARAADGAGHRAAVLEGEAAQAEAAYNAARVAAELAESGCLDAREVLAECEEEVGRRASSASPPVAARRSPLQSVGQHVIPQRGHTAEMLIPATVSPLARLLQGDRAALLGIALRLADDTGLEAGRLQLLLVELRELAVDRAIEAHAVAFPDDHPFWGQFSGEEARRVVASLTAMGYRFDGSGWLDGRTPNSRDLAVAVSHAGFDPRSLRRPEGQPAIDRLWQGSRVLVEEFLLSNAPDLDLAQITQTLGPRASRLGELWDFWGRLRPLLAA